MFIHDAERRATSNLYLDAPVVRLDVCSRRGASCYSILYRRAPPSAGGCFVSRRGSVVLTLFVSRTLRVVRVGMFVHERGASLATLFDLDARVGGLDVIYHDAERRATLFCISIASASCGLDVLFTTRSVVLLCLRKTRL